MSSPVRVRLPRRLTVSSPPPSPASPNLRDILRQYNHLANWEYGYAVHECVQVTGVTSTHVPVTKRSAALIPLDGLLAYYEDIDLVVGRLETAAAELARRWNARTVKSALEWRDLICRCDWDGRDGRAESTLFELVLSTYAFYVHNLENPEASITEADIKVSD